MKSVTFLLCSAQFAVIVMCALRWNSPNSVSTDTREMNVDETRRRQRGILVETAPAAPRLCGDGLCHCHKHSANCSNHPSGLHYVPPLPDYVWYLHFSYNLLTTIPSDFFQNVTGLNLTGVDLSHNNLTDISPDAFRPLLYLQTLFLSANKGLNYSSLSPAFQVSTLTELDVMSCALGPGLPADLFHNVSMPRLRTLVLHDNRLGLGLTTLDLDVIKPLVALKELGLASNDIISIRAKYTTGLEKLNLDTNSMFEFPPTCSEELAPWYSLFPRLRYLFLQGNSIHSMPETDVCLPKLEVLALGKNQFSQLRTGTFSTHRFPSLKQVSLYSMSTLVSVIEENAFNNSMLERISLAYNSIKFQSDSISNESLANCPRLNMLQLSHNFMEVDDDRFLQLFGHLTQLRLLDLQNTRLTFISPRMLASFPNLTHLQLNRNLLTSLTDGVFDPLAQLRHVDLGRNQIRVISADTFGIATRRGLKSLDLSGNPFTCSCDVLWFQGWLASRPLLFSKSWTSYTCHNIIPHMLLQRFHLPPQACILPQGVSLIIITSVSFITVTLTVVFTVFRFRWHLRLLLYEVFRGRGDVRRRRLETGHFDYDVFVSYDSKDLPWVRQHLLPELEGRLGLRLCVHERDFIIGRDVVDNIADSVERSKKVMMLFSNTFVKSHWCQFELTFCLRHVMDYEDALIIACLDDVSSRHLTVAMMAVLKTTTSIHWMDEPDAVASFWGRLHLALQEVIQQRARRDPGVMIPH